MDEISRRELLCTGLGAGLGLAALGLPRPAAAAYKPMVVKAPCRLSGVVRYRGKAARPKPVKLSGDCAYCRRFDLRDESLLVGPGGGLRNVALTLRGIHRGKPLPSGTLPVMAERRCTFTPHVLSVTAGSKIVLHNDDPVLNTFHAIARPTGRTLFNVGTPRKGQKIKRRIKPAGLVEMRCDVHPWEVAYIVSLPHPYHAVSAADGAFALDQIPAGDYTLALWHEKLGVQQRKVRLGPGQHLKLKLTYG